MDNITDSEAGSNAGPAIASVWPSLAAVFLAFFAYSLMIGSMSVALPRMAAELRGMPLYATAVAAPAVASALSTLLFGKLSDIYGRRALLLIAISLYLLGVVLCALSPTFVFLCGALFVLGFGQGAIAPLSYAILGDLFPPVARSRWAGWLNVPAGVASLMGPTAGGWLVDNLGWRHVFTLTIPFILVSLGVAAAALPKLAAPPRRRIDLIGSLLLSMATGSMMAGLILESTTRSAWSPSVTGLLMLSGVLWALFLVVEARTTEPMLDPHVLRNRTVLIASLSALLSSLGLTAISAYYPLFLQAVQGGSATLAGKIMTPFSVLVSFMGVPAGLLLGRTRRYKWMYVGGYAILTASLAVLARFSATTPVAWGLAVAALAGIGFGTIPTLNAMVVQYAVPRRLLGAAGGAFFFFVMMGRSVSPSILGSALDASYARELGSHLPVSVVERINATSAGSSTGPGALLSEQSKRELEAAVCGPDHQGDTTCEAIWSAVRNSLETALRRVFLVGAIAMGVSLLLIVMIPGNLLRPAGQERGKRQPAEAG